MSLPGYCAGRFGRLTGALCSDRALGRQGSPTLRPQPAPLPSPRLRLRADLREDQRAKPSDIQVEQPTEFDLIVNLRAEKALGLTVQPSVLARADAVIE